MFIINNLTQIEQGFTTLALQLSSTLGWRIESQSNLTCCSPPPCIKLVMTKKKKSQSRLTLCRKRSCIKFHKTNKSKSSIQLTISTNMNTAQSSTHLTLDSNFYNYMIINNNEKSLDTTPVKRFHLKISDLSDLRRNRNWSPSFHPRLRGRSNRDFFLDWLEIT